MSWGICELLTAVIETGCPASRVTKSGLKVKPDSSIVIP